jgi:acid phosphatase type 7
MTVNRRTGVVTWTARPGRFVVTVLVRNARGSARQRFPLVVTPPPPSSRVVLAAGDIASCVNDNDEATARILDANPSAAVLTLGDNVYDAGTVAEFANCYAPSWGRHRARTHPAPGNHDFATSGAAGYFGYFGDRAGPSTAGYYSFDIGDWHLISLNSERDAGASGAQVAWLRSDLAATAKKCVLAYWHKPRFTAGTYSDFADYTAFWRELYAAGAEVVLNGHDHNYQRYRPMTPAGAIDAVGGIREFVVGTGGVGSYPLQPDSRRDVAGTNIFGVLELTLRSDSYDWKFLPAKGTIFTDSGTGACR